MAEHKKGLLSKAGETVNKARDLFAIPLPESVPVTEKEKESLRPGIIDLAGGFLASRALPLLAAVNPLGGALALLSYGLLSGQSRKRRKLAERLVDQESVRRKRNFEMGVHEQQAGFNIASSATLSMSRMNELMKQITATQNENELDRKFQAEQGLLNRDASERVAITRGKGDKLLATAQSIIGIDKALLKNAENFNINRPQAEESAKGLNQMKALMMIAFLKDLDLAGFEATGLTPEAIVEMFKDINPSDTTSIDPEGDNPFSEELTENEDGEWVIKRTIE